MDWRERASCADPDIDPGVFFPPVEHRVPRGWEKKAIEVCKMCAVNKECLNEALKRRETEGVWGGLTGWERHLRKGGPRPSRGRPRPTEE
ncbi:WhiB family transcriptional regulator [Streptomyces sp. NPDC093595]|uniref:WhiB family transcriptional regulator n=1 Tax=Streptomyces sp. NPDC093595 TaxID=3366045 RepID=UPI0038165B64